MVIMSQVACIILSFKMYIGKKIENSFGCGKKISEEKDFLSFLFYDSLCNNLVFCKWNNAFTLQNSCKIYWNDHLPVSQELKL